MEVRTRAPGKIIFTGEHAVVHGSTAVAASVDLYTYVTLTSANINDDDRLNLQLRDAGLEFSWPIGRIKSALSHLGCPTPSAPATCSSENCKLISALLEEKDIPEANVAIASGVVAFLWLYTSIQGFRPATVVVTSDLPMGSGLGSSAAFCVALSAAFLGLRKNETVDIKHQVWFPYKEPELEMVNKWAFEGEKIIHGKPSGIDNAVSTYGNVIKFKSGELNRIKSCLPLKMLITNTRVGRNTKALVAGVAERTLRHLDAMNNVFNAVDSISNELADIIQSPAVDELSITEKEAQVEELIEMNQGLLQCMGVSHSSIETVLRTTSKYKLCSKLTGAGGGGCVLTLLPTFLSSQKIDKVKAELESYGFQCFTAGIGGQGAQFFADRGL